MKTISKFLKIGMLFVCLLQLSSCFGTEEEKCEGKTQQEKNQCMEKNKQEKTSVLKNVGNLFQGITAL